MFYLKLGWAVSPHMIEHWKQYFRADLAL